jgi:RHS repeat-associated protein
VSESVNGEPWALASSYSYLNTGQAETRGQTAYTYNRSQRLTKVTESGIIKGTYQYNSSGQRVSKTANGITTHFHYNLAGQLLAETTDAGEVIRQYVYLGGMPVAMLTGNKAYDGVASTQQELVGETNLSVNAEGSTEKTSLMAVTGNQIISAKLTDMSEKTGKEFYGLTLREQVEGDKGAKINVYFSAKNTSSLNMITVKTPEGKIVPIPMFGRSTGAEALEIDIVYAGGSLAHEQFERSGDWVKLERNDQYVSVLTSVDGINWIMLREFNLPTVDDAYMGVVAMNTKAAFDIRYTAANDNLFYLHTDHLGSVVAVSSNSTKSKVWQRRDFDIGASPFGLDVLPNGEKLHDGLFKMPLRFPGQYYDQETGTNYNYYRDYDASTGRYIQSDPIGLNGGMNTYVYVEGNPLGYVDPFGLDGFNAQLADNATYHAITNCTFYLTCMNSWPSTPSSNSSAANSVDGATNALSSFSTFMIGETTKAAICTANNALQCENTSDGRPLVPWIPKMDEGMLKLELPGIPGDAYFNGFQIIDKNGKAVDWVKPWEEYCESINKSFKKP